MRIKHLISLLLVFCVQWITHSHASANFPSSSSNSIHMIKFGNLPIDQPARYFYDQSLSSDLSPAIHSLFKRDLLETNEDKLRKNNNNKKATTTSEKPLPSKPLRSNSSKLLLTSGSNNGVNDDVSSSSLTATTPADLPELDDMLKPPPANFTNPTKSKDDNHTYYTTKMIFANETYARQLWFPMDSFNNSKRHEMLSNAHRRAATVRLSFKFPFYGHEIENITIATGGFLFLGEAIHTWLAATQYIAPLMANFNTSISNTSNIYYYDNGTAFIVQWDRVYLQEASNATNLINNTFTNPSSTSSSLPPSAQPFSFQVTLHRNGEIFFVYLKVPMSIDKISEDKHPVKVGISDAYIIERAILFIRRKTIYEYHKSEMKRHPITDYTVIHFMPAPTCIAIKDCETCLKPNVTNFDCGWCESLGRCSDGYDRHRHSWMIHNCEDQAAEQRCPAPGSNALDSLKPANNGQSLASNNVTSTKSDNRTNQIRKNGNGFGVLTILMLIAMVSGVAFWSFYAYKNPQSSSGQFLIKYRPTQWKFGPTDA